MSQPLLQIEQLRIAFGDKAVVHGIDLQIQAGEKVALVGESGSGKSVTALSLLRLAAQARCTGHVWLSARDPDAPRQDLLSLPEPELLGVRGDDIAMIFQEPMTALNPLFTVGEQIVEVLQLKKGLNRREAWPLAVQALADTGLPEPERRARAYPHQLSGGQRQRAMIAMALATEPRLLLADEPTTALDVTLRAQILDLLSALQARTGMAVLLITHDLQMVRRFADRVAVMEHGHLVEQGPVAEVFAHPQHPYTRQLLDSVPAREVIEVDPQAPTPATVLRAQDLRVAYAVPRPGWRGWFGSAEFVAVQGASFELAAGRTLGVVGESGSGKSTLAQAVLGLLPFSGQLDLGGQTWQGLGTRNTPAHRALRRQVQVVFQDPFSSLSPRLTVEEIVGEGLQVHEPGLPLPERRRRVMAALSDVGLSEAQFPGLLARYPHEFSGGQRQRLAIARALIVQPRWLVLDEPTSALDVSIQKQVLQLLQGLQRERGLSYLLITHDIAVIRAMAHEVLVMKDGAVVEAGPVQQLLSAPRSDYTRTLVHAALD
ncbi:dipeptide ABC transporter ATP-binding protein [Curvibacter sp. HBC61]|uniref:Dipeptide ABC transporter ATP-binding protein n=1 Tax=Curvibacter cyanobacteriorum TaxID=3026422 RepID=A0ABT5MVX2_9BURK|nr:dipeptide ABC transporter ATP-binding protein [Curvibacter sp. HBC61]MDD0837474.1 dipeptide ABC transporter ATP-binding protein [Curvibacter sp. HBC61]